MRDKKVYIVLLVSLIVFFVVMFSMFGIENINQEKYTSTIIVGEQTIWRYEKKKWISYNDNSIIDKINWQKFLVYDNNIEKGTYSVWFDDKWYLFDDDKNAILLDGNLLAISSNFDMKVSSFEEKEIDDFTYVQYVLDDNELSVNSKFTSNYKVSFDFDGDGVDEDFYVISNVFPLDFNPDYIFSIAFMVKNDEIYYIYNDISPNKSFNGCKPYYNTFLDTNNDGVFELILSCGRYSNQDTIDMLYEFREDGFKILISNQ